MKVVLGSDHGGYETKLVAIEYLKENNIDFVDLGCYSKDSVDYSEYGIKVAEMVRDNEGYIGIVVCTTGIGISIAANKVKGIRAALCFNEKVAMMTRLHNNSNVLALPGAYLDKEETKKIVHNFLTTEFEGGRHTRRVDIISNYDNNR
jgi:ribose 5-phosphate isomerase B